MELLLNALLPLDNIARVCSHSCWIDVGKLHEARLVMFSEKQKATADPPIQAVLLHTVGLEVRCGVLRPTLPQSRGNDEEENGADWTHVCQKINARFTSRDTRSFASGPSRSPCSVKACRARFD